MEYIERDKSITQTKNVRLSLSEYPELKLKGIGICKGKVLREFECRKRFKCTEHRFLV